MLLLTRLDSRGDYWREELSKFVADNPALARWFNVHRDRTRALAAAGAA
jgi:hypothetical protein